MPKTELALYHYWRSSSSWRVRWGLNLKKVAYNAVAVDLLSGEEKSGEHFVRNPAKYLPTLQINGRYLSESLAILEWLEEEYPEPSLFAGDKFMRAKIRQLAETVNAGIQPLQNLDVMRRVSEDKEIQKKWVQHWIARGLGVYEELIAEHKGKYSVSDTPTLADLCLIPQCHSALRFDVDLQEFSRCKAIYEHAITTAECAEAHPDKFQPAR